MKTSWKRSWKRIGRRSIAALLLPCALLAADSVLAQSYPRAPVRLILPFVGGSATDITFRALAAGMEKTLGQNVLVDPRPGAGTILAVNEMKKAAADGYTLIITTNS